MDGVTRSRVAGGCREQCWGQREYCRGEKSGYSGRSTGVAEEESVAESGRGSSSVGVAAMSGQL